MPIDASLKIVRRAEPSSRAAERAIVVVMAVGEALRGPSCPSCGQFGLRMVEGCTICPSCDHSKCG